MTTVDLNPHAAFPPDVVPVIMDLTGPQFRQRIDDALAAYVAAMGYPTGTERNRAPTWAEHIARPGWQAAAALLTVPGESIDPLTSPMVAIGYGYRGAAHQWWHQQVHNGMRRTGWSARATHDLLGNYFEVTELHVHPNCQGRGVGAAILTRLLAHRPEHAALLSTPEVEDEDNRAWRLYRRFGFTDVIRRFTFAGDRRPFAILRCDLPPPGPGLWSSYLPTQ